MPSDPTVVEAAKCLQLGICRVAVVAQHCKMRFARGLHGVAFSIETRMRPRTMLDEGYLASLGLEPQH